jgi:hypothetical protein
MLPAILLTGCGTALDQQYQQLKAQLTIHDDFDRPLQPFDVHLL